MLNSISFAVVVPVYKAEPTGFEQMALEQCFKVFTNCDVIAVSPQKLTLNDDRFAKTIHFEDDYFESVFGYNRLMLSTEFYSQFKSYTYILIYQLDAFAFSNSSLYWCNKGYDYIGAPWLRDYSAYSTFKQFKESIRSYFHRRYNIKGKSGLPALDKQLKNQVGNGGFSLRKVSRFIEICDEYRQEIENYKKHNSNFFNEDIFFCIEINRKKSVLKIPNYKEAVGFAIETCPNIALEINNGKLPFGCHAWEKNLDFWRPYFKAQGFEI